MNAGRAGPVPLRLSTVHADEVTAVLAVAGEIDIGTVGDLSKALSDLLNGPRLRRLVLDFAEVGFLDASGIAALVTAHRSGRDRGTTVELINCRPLPQRVLEITGMDKVLLASDDDGP